MKNNDYMKKVWREVQTQREAEEAKRSRVRGQRDLQFSGSVQRVIKRLPEFPNWIGYSPREWREETTEILTQYAYDLVLHALQNIDHIDLDRLTIKECIQRIPDLQDTLEEEF